MPVLRLIDIKTAASDYTLAVSRSSSGERYTARYWRKPPSLGTIHGRDEISHSVTHDDVDMAVHFAIAQIEKLEGRVLSMYEDSMCRREECAAPGP